MTAHETYMRTALEAAREAARLGEIPVGDPLGHAEINAIRQACQRLGSWRLDGCVLYVTLEPCPMCAGAILNARISRVVYGAADPKAGCMGSVCDLTAMPFPTVPYYKSGVLEAECRAELDRFFRGLRQREAAADQM